MKKLLTALILFLSLSIGAQEKENSAMLQPGTNLSSILEENDVSFAQAAETNTIAHRTFTNLTDIYNGYYIIAGVFSKSQEKAAKKYKKKGYNSGYIANPENGLNYLYIDYQSDWKESISKVTSKFNGKYKDEVWIMEVENSKPAMENPTKEDFITNNSSEESIAENLTSKSIDGTPNKSKLIQRADYYFNKMWYAEAADLYEMALKKNEKNYSYDVLQKAGDSHYFNTDMEKAYHWYNILYEKYEKEMSADNIFKYAHSLKGTGKYARSKRLMRLYNRKLKKEDLAAINNPSEATPNEIVLDNILGTSKKFEVKNLSVNSEYSEFSPMFHDDNRVVYASAKDSSFFNTRRYKWNNQPYLDLYVAKINEESQELKDAIKFSKKVNTKYHEAAVTFAPDNRTMYFTRNNYGKKLKRDKKGVNHLKIYQSKKIDGEWTEATELPFNSDNYSTGHPALSPDGKELYFVSDMPGSIGETDIFMVDVREDGSFSEPRNLGPEINTERREMFPFINDKKLYFSSDGHTGLGGLDVYEVSFEEEEGFLDVVNLGQPINSNKDDFSYIIDEETQKGYFASNREGGRGDDDIYAFKNLVLEEIPANTNAIDGVVTELITGDVMPKALVELLDENNIKLKEVLTGDDGSFIFEDLEATTKYVIKTTKGTYFDDLQEVTTKENDTISVDVSLRKLKEMIAVEDGIKKLKTEMIHFDFDKSYIREDAAVELDKLVEVMTEYPNMVIKIESHTDSRGKRAYNKYLSDKRAKSSRDYIISKGIAAERIESAIGYGEERLINECDGTVRCTEQKHYLNRRSEFIIVKM
ncbi:WD40 repeat protein [Maribacter vaceletii]|uniref:WD40 repeat protein n=1 Tax=Maribacter vaceletii TaxID=1206816 RepID=A0A495EDS5_9FLAO|nr:OmpA family protein [Maribacter vaceletii]RKR14789.1 WD40 repeat protein [Maribacter vaceletii]